MFYALSGKEDASRWLTIRYSIFNSRIRTSLPCQLFRHCHRGGELVKCWQI